MSHVFKTGATMALPVWNHSLAGCRIGKSGERCRSSPVIATASFRLLHAALSDSDSRSIERAHDVEPVTLCFRDVDNVSVRYQCRRRHISSTTPISALYLLLPGLRNLITRLKQGGDEDSQRKTEIKWET